MSAWLLHTDGGGPQVVAWWQLAWKAVEVTLGWVSVSDRKMCLTVGNIRRKDCYLFILEVDILTGFLGTRNALIRINILNLGLSAQETCRVRKARCFWCV